MTQEWTSLSVIGPYTILFISFCLIVDFWVMRSIFHGNRNIAPLFLLFMLISLVPFHLFIKLDNLSPRVFRIAKNGL